MNNEELFNSLRNLNNAKVGSLGEFIFYHESLKQGLKIDSLHEQRIDFVINGTIHIDVKTSFKTEGAELYNSPIGMYSAHRYEGIKYALVELFSDGIRISIDGSLFSEINLDEVKNYWESWNKNKTERKSQQHQKSNQSTFKPIRDGIIKFFEENHALSARVIYRTVQQGFGKESPDNLAPKLVSPRSVTIFIDFKDKRISLDNINRIIAFPDVCSTTFPMIKKPTLHLEKIDLDALDQMYKFRDVEDLYTNFQRRFISDNEAK